MLTRPNKPTPPKAPPTPETPPVGPGTGGGKGTGGGTVASIVISIIVGFADLIYQDYKDRANRKPVILDTNIIMALGSGTLKLSDIIKPGERPVTIQEVLDEGRKNNATSPMFSAQFEAGLQKLIDANGPGVSHIIPTVAIDGQDISAVRSVYEKFGSLSEKDKRGIGADAQLLYTAGVSGYRLVTNDTKLAAAATCVKLDVDFRDISGTSGPKLQRLIYLCNR